MSSFALLPDPPYYVVSFSSQRTAGDNGYELMADKIAELAAKQDGYLGVESVRGKDGFGITNSYWRDEIAGRARWYAHYEVRIARVERAYNLHTKAAL